MFRHLHLHESADLCISTECRDERERERERECFGGGIMGYYTGTRRNTSFLRPRIGAELTDRREPWGVGLRAKGPQKTLNPLASKQARERERDTERARECVA